jgi:NAD(P)-dependent dehydrogenase (short-subunit alcohol dehydrogenase family)/acyl carrier protein
VLVVCDPPADAAAARGEQSQRQRHHSLTSALLASVHALLDAVAATPLWIVTAGAVAPDDAAVRDPGAATAWGVGHVVELEHPELGCRRVDVGDGPVDAAARRLVRELHHPDTDEPQVAWRGGGRYVPRLTPGHLPSQATVELDPDASYLVSGGLRGVGLLVSDWVIRHGARHLVLFGRQEPGPDAAAAIERWSLQGATVVVEQADASLDGDMSRVIERARELGPLRGVMHCAGVLADASLLRQDWAHFEAVYGPKVFGTAALTRHLPLHELDFLVLFASAAGVAGWPGQANYSAANAFLDATAHELRAEGVRAVSIDWGPWKDVGMAVSRGIDQTPAAFSVEQGLAVLEQVMGAVAARSAPAQLVVRSSDWSDVLERYPAGAEPSLLRDLLRTRRDGSPCPVDGEPDPAPAPLTASLAGLPERRQRMIVRDEVRRLAALVLDLDDAERIELGEPLHDLGMDSLMAVELRNRVGVALGAELPATLLFEHPSVTALVEHLFDSVLAPGVSPVQMAPAVDHRNGAEVGPSPDRDADMRDAEEMDADQLALALAARLDRLGGRS